MPEENFRIVNELYQQLYQESKDVCPTSEKLNAMIKSLKNVNLKEGAEIDDTLAIIRLLLGHTTTATLGLDNGFGFVSYLNNTISLQDCYIVEVYSANYSSMSDLPKLLDYAQKYSIGGLLSVDVQCEQNGSPDAHLISFVKCEDGILKLYNVPQHSHATKKLFLDKESNTWKIGHVKKEPLWNIWRVKDEQPVYHLMDYKCVLSLHLIMRTDVIAGLIESQRKKVEEKRGRVLEELYPFFARV